MLLRVNRWFCGRPGHAHVAAVGPQLARLDVVGKVDAENLAEHALLQRWVRDGDHHLDAVVEIARHQIRAADVDFLVAAVAEIPGAAVLEEPSDDAAHADVLAQAGNTWTQAADAAHDQVNTNAGLRSRV